MKRTICFLLSVFLLFAAFAGCTTNAPLTTTDNGSGVSAVSTGYQPGATTVATVPPEEPDVFDPTEGAPEFKRDPAMIELMQQFQDQIDEFEIGHTVIYGDAEQLYTEGYTYTLWYMPQLAAYAAACAERFSDASESLRAAADAARALAGPAQPMPVVPAGLSDAELLSRLKSVLSAWYATPYFFSYGGTVQEYTDENGSPYKLVDGISCSRGGDFPVAEGMLNVILNIYQALRLLYPYDNYKQFQAGHLERFLTEEELAGYREFGDCTLIETTDSYGLRRFSLESMPPNGRLEFKLTEKPIENLSDFYAINTLSDGVFWLPCAYQGYITYRVINSYGEPGELFSLAVAAAPSLLDTPVTFQNPRLEQVVRTYLGNSDGALTRADLSGITSIDAHLDTLVINKQSIVDRDITSFQAAVPLSDPSDFYWFENLTELRLTAQGLTSLRGFDPVIKNFGRSMCLDFSYNQITDLSPLYGVRCAELSFAGNGISRFPDLGNIELNKLDLSKNELVSIDLGSCFVLDLYVASNPLTALRLRGMGNYIDCSFTKLSALDYGTKKDYIDPDNPDGANPPCLFEINASYTGVTSDELSYYGGCSRIFADGSAVDSLDFLKNWNDQERDALTLLSLQNCGLTLGAVEAELLRRCPNLINLNLDGNTLLPEFVHPLVTK